MMMHETNTFCAAYPDRFFHTAPALFGGPAAIRKPKAPNTSLGGFNRSQRARRALNSRCRWRRRRIPRSRDKDRVRADDAAIVDEIKKGCDAGAVALHGAHGGGAL